MPGNNLRSFRTNLNKTMKWGDGGIIGGKTTYHQMKLNDKFVIHKENGLNKHKSNIRVDKPYDYHIKPR